MSPIRPNHTERLTVMLFDPDKAVEYVDQNQRVWPARILASDLVSGEPIVAGVRYAHFEDVVRAGLDGTIKYSTAYLRNRMVRREGWVRVTDGGDGRRGVAGSVVFAHPGTAAESVRVFGGFVARIEWEEPA